MKKWIYLILILVFAGMTQDCTQQKKGSEPIRILVPQSLSSLPLLMIDGKTIDGKDIKVELFTDHTLSMAQFIRDEVDILMTGFTLGMNTAKEHRNIRHFITPVWGVSSLITLDPGITVLEDFNGKRIAVPFPGSPLELQLLHILHYYHLDETIILEYCPIQQSVPLLIQGKISGICVPEPLGSKLVLENNGYTIFRFRDAWKEVTDGEDRSPQVSLFVKGGFLKEHSPFLSALKKALIQAIVQLDEHPDKVAEEFSHLFSLSHEVVLAGITNTLFGIPGREESNDIIKEYIRLIFPDNPPLPGFLE